MRHWHLTALIGVVLTLGFTAARADCPTGDLCVCTGDCGLDGETDIVELQGCVNLFLSGDQPNLCEECDANFDGEVDIVDLQGAVNSFLDSTTCPTATLARINIGSTAGAKGAQVNLPISLSAQVDDIVTIAPVRLNFNAAALSFVSCSSAVAGKTVAAASPSAGTLSLVLYADPFAAPPQSLTAIPHGTIANCTFGIAGNAPTGPSPVTFASAGLADSVPRDFVAVGSNGGVTVQ